MVRVVLLAGGVGGARMAEGFAALPDVSHSVVGNIADDDAFHGLWVSPDIDTLTYTLAGLVDRSQGWGVADEGHRALGVLASLGQPTWMTLGDRDLGLHIYRTMRRARGDRPSQIARDVAAAFGVGPAILLPTDDRVQTRIETAAGTLSFQEYFVRERCAPEVTGLWFDGAEAATPAPEALEAIAAADVIVVAPSNPLVSIDPILAVPGLHDAVVEAGAPVVAVSPLIAGKAVKGPAARMMAELGFEASACGIARHYQGLADALLIDESDAEHAPAIAALGVEPVAAPILMAGPEAKQALARRVLEAAT